MVQILRELQQYVPFAQKAVGVDVDGEDEPHELIIDRFHSILLGRDQLTVSRIRSAQAARLNSESGSGQLRGYCIVSNRSLPRIEAGSAHFDKIRFVLNFR